MQQKMTIRTPRFLDLELTNTCNLRCKYCYHFSSPGDVEQDLPTSEWLSFFDELGQCGVISVSLSGGEPMMRKDFPELVNGIVQNRMRYSVVTNGTLITEQIIDCISSTSRCDMIFVSLDGSFPETHDSCRGNGTFERAVHGIKLIREAGLSVSVRATVHKSNFHELSRIAEFTLGEIGVDYFSANIASLMGLCKANAETVLLNARERTEAMSDLIVIKERYGDKIKDFGLLSDTVSWLKMQEALDSNCKNQFGGCLCGCGGVYDTIAVRADGVITPCVQLNHMPLGRINQSDLTDVWQNHPTLKRIRARQQTLLAEFEFCKDCEYLRYCTGGCPGLTYSVIGLDHHPSPDTCLRVFLREGGKLPNVTPTCQAKP